MRGGYIYKVINLKTYICYISLGGCYRNKDTIEAKRTPYAREDRLLPVFDEQSREFNDAQLLGLPC